MSDDGVLDQNEIERLLGGGGGGAPPPPPEPAQPAGGAEEDGPMSQADLESLFSSLGGGAPAPAAPAPPPPRTPAPGPTAFFAESEPTASGDASALDQGDIESLLRGAPPFAASAPPPPPPPPLQHSSSAAAGMAQGAAPIGHLGRLPVSTTVSADEEGVPQGDIDYLLRRAEEALDSISTSKMDLPNEVIEFQYPEFGGTIPNVEHATLDQISEVELDVKIELGRANMYLEDVLKLRKGAVVPLDKMAGDAVDIYVNGRLLARGEVLVMNENFCVRVAELLAGAIPLE